MSVMVPLCSLSDSLRVRVVRVASQMRTWPSIWRARVMNNVDNIKGGKDRQNLPAPPLIILKSPSLFHASVTANAVTHPLCASPISYCNRPLCGPNARIFPSFHPLINDEPSFLKVIHLHSRLGTAMRRSSVEVWAFQMRISVSEAVANTSEECL